MIFVGIGGALGAMIRYLVGKWIMNKTTTLFPLGTWLINISGSFSLGILVALHMNSSINEWLWLLLGVGFLGAYTTFSTFGYEVLQLLQNKLQSYAIVYVVTSVVLGILFAFLGAWIGQIIV